MYYKQDLYQIYPDTCTLTTWPLQKQSTFPANTKQRKNILGTSTTLNGRSQGILVK